MQEKRKSGPSARELTQIKRQAWWDGFKHLATHRWTLGPGLAGTALATVATTGWNGIPQAWAWIPAVAFGTLGLVNVARIMQETLNYVSGKCEIPDYIRPDEEQKRFMEKQAQPDGIRETINTQRRRSCTICNSSTHRTLKVKLTRSSGAATISSFGMCEECQYTEEGQAHIAVTELFARNDTGSLTSEEEILATRDDAKRKFRENQATDPS